MTTTPIAIPSAHRADKRARTLEQLLPLEGALDVTWYVPDGQVPAYRAHLPGWCAVVPVRHAETVDVARGVIMADHAGGDVVTMEDDVPWFIGARAVFDPRNHPGSAPSTPRLNVADVAAMGDRLLAHDVTRMWGIYPVSYSGTALKPRVGIGSLFCVGHCVGLRLTDGWAPRLRLPIKEDYELTALAVERWGHVARLDLVAPYSISGKGTGGSVYRNPVQEGEAVAALMARWPGLFTEKGEREGLPQVAMAGDAPVQWTTVAPEPGWAPYA